MKYLLTHFQDEIKPVLHKIVLEKSEHIRAIREIREIREIRAHLFAIFEFVIWREFRSLLHFHYSNYKF